jgi:hypothetical protein
MSRRLWERALDDDRQLDVRFAVVSDSDLREEPEPLVDAAWLAARTAAVPQTIGRRRLDAILFAQRAFPDPQPPDAGGVATAVRGFLAFPALVLTLERFGSQPAVEYARAAGHAHALGRIGPEAARRSAVAQFQSVVGIIDRAHRSGALADSSAQQLLTSLTGLEVSADRGYEGRIARWLRTRLRRALPDGPDGDESLEAAILSAMAGPSTPATAAAIEWEGQRYRVDPAGAERRRLREIRRRQAGSSIDAAIEAAIGREDELRRRIDQVAEQRLADALASVLYASYLGDPSGQAVTSGNVALRHDFGVVNGKGDRRSTDAWRLPVEDFGARGGWRLRGSILGLEAALARLSLKRIDPASMPAEPKIATADRQNAALTVALLNPYVMSDAARDEIAAALARGRARAAALTADPAELDGVAKTAGLSEWRRQALAWTIGFERGSALGQLSLVELFWLGSPRPSLIRSLDDWGAAALPLTGCLCLKMPAARAWEEMSGRPSTGLLSTRAVDVALQVADTLAALQLPASLAASVLGFAMQDVTEQARPAYAEDWDEFGRAALELPRDRLTDYVAALTSHGPLVPADLRRPH